MKIELDVFEIAFLAEACIPPVPIARAMFWERMINEIYDKLNDDERAKIFEWICKESKFNKEHQECQWFYARYNPNNQFEVDCFFNGKVGTHKCFRKDDKYWVNRSKNINPEYIKEVRKL